MFYKGVSVGENKSFMPTLAILVLILITACASRPPRRMLLPGELAREPSGVGFAVPLAKKAEEEDESPGQYQSLRDQGITDYKAGDLMRASSQLEAAFLIYPESKDFWARHLLFYCQMSIGEYRAAKATAEEILRKRPYSALGYQQIGMTQLWLGEYAEALQNFQRALEFASHSPRVHFYLALTRGMLNQPAAKTKSFGDAEAEYLQILKSNPADVTANLELASLYLHWNRGVDVVPDLIAKAKKGLDQDNDQEIADKKLYQTFYLPFVEGIYLYRKSATKASLQALFTSLANAPSGAKADLTEIFYYIARNLSDSGNRSGARGFLERGLSMDPSGPLAKEMKQLSREIASRENTSP